MFFALLLAFLIAPIAEIAVLLKAGDVFGVLPVLIACIVTAVLGGALIRQQGLKAIERARAELQSGRPPVASAFDGALLAAAAPFLMTPGFLTDAVGFALLIPPLRRALGRAGIAWLWRKMRDGDARVTIIER